MSADAEANPLTACTVMLPAGVMRLLKARATTKGRPVEFEIALTAIQGANLQAYACNMPQLAHEMANEARAYCLLNGYPEAINVTDNPF